MTLGVVQWCSGYHCCTTSFSKAWTQALRRFKSYSRRVRDLPWWEYLTYLLNPVGNKTQWLSSVNHTTKTIHHLRCPSSSKLSFFHKNTQQGYFVQPKLWILTNLQYQYLSATTNVNLSPTLSLNIKILFKCDISSCAQTGITAVGDRASPIHYRINKSFKPPLKVHRLNITKNLVVSLRSHF